MQRNRTICALSRALVLIEARATGGTFAAGEAALAMGLPLFTADYSTQLESNDGNRILLERGAVRLRQSRATGRANLTQLFAMESGERAGESDAAGEHGLRPGEPAESRVPGREHGHARERDEVRAKILRNPPNRTANPAMIDTVTLRVSIAADAEPGEREIRLAGPNALSNPMRFCVGALPENPTNALKYNLTWSTDGLINEYCNPCEAVRDGIRSEVPALEEVEHFSLDGTEYEAFNTSGGLGTLCDTLEGKVENLNYKTVRYPGHRDIVKMLVRDLRLGIRREILKDVLETAIPITYQDVVLIFVTVSGWQGGLLTQESTAKKIYAQEVGGKLMSAIQVTTAAGICAMCDLLVEGKLPQSGFVRQEEARLADFLANRFGAYYA